MGETSPSGKMRGVDDGEHVLLKVFSCREDAYCLNPVSEFGVQLLSFPFNLPHQTSPLGVFLEVS